MCVRVLCTRAHPLANIAKVTQLFVSFHFQNLNMCVKKRYVFRKDGSSVLVKCGKCKECIQEKAFKRSNMIRFNEIAGYVTLFLTLTYSNEFCPYVRQLDIDSLTDSDSKVNIYRDSSIIGVLPIEEPLPFCRYHHLTNCGSDFIGVLFYDDLFKFQKRFRINYQRLCKQYGLQYNKLYFYSIGEYGATFARPHFHIKLQVSRETSTIAEQAFLKSWSYDVHRPERCQYVQSDVSSYLSTYLAGTYSLPRLYHTKEIRPRSFHSSFYGCNQSVYSLHEVISSFYRHNLYVVRCGFSTSPDPPSGWLSCPEQFLLRYFPKIKGYSRLNSSALFNVMSQPETIACYSYQLGYRHLQKYESRNGQIVDDARTTIGTINRCYARAFEDSGISRTEWAFIACQIWHLVALFRFRSMYQRVHVERDNFDLYDNIHDIVIEKERTQDGDFAPFMSRSPTLLDLCLKYDFTCTPDYYNKRKEVVNRNKHLTQIFNQSQKIPRINNYVMRQLNKNL